MMRTSLFATAVFLLVTLSGCDAFGGGEDEADLNGTWASIFKTDGERDSYMTISDDRIDIYFLTDFNDGCYMTYSIIIDRIEGNVIYGKDSSGNNMRREYHFDDGNLIFLDQEFIESDQDVSVLTTCDFE